MALKDTLDLGQSLFDLAKSIGIVVLIIVLVASPELIDKALRGLGVEEFEFFGLKGKTSLIAMETQVHDLEATNATLKKQLADSVALLGSIEPTKEVTTQAVQQTINDAKTAISTADSVSEATQTVLKNNAQVIQAAQSAIGSAGSWAVVYSADTSEEMAKTEVDRAAKGGLGTAQIYLRQKLFRSALSFATNGEARSKLSAIQALSSHARGAYIVNLDSWCPNPVPVHPSLLDCHQ